MAARRWRSRSRLITKTGGVSSLVPGRTRARVLAASGRAGWLGGRRPPAGAEREGQAWVCRPLLGPGPERSASASGASRGDTGNPGEIDLSGFAYHAARGTLRGPALHRIGRRPRPQPAARPRPVIRLDFGLALIRRRLDGPPRRRHPDADHQLALDLLRQRTDRHRGPGVGRPRTRVRAVSASARGPTS